MSNTITKTTRFYLDYDEKNADGLKYSDLCKILWKCQDEVRAALNEMVNEYQLYVRRMINEYDNTGKWPKNAEIKEWYGCSLQTQLYRVAMVRTVSLGSAPVTALANANLSKWNGKFKDYISGKDSLPSFKGNQPIPIPKKYIKLTSDSGTEYLDISVIAKSCSKELGLKDGIFGFRIFFSPKDTGTKAIVDNCISGAYQHNAGSLCYDKKKKKWYFNLTYTMPKTKKELGGGVCGVDLGIANVAYCAVYNSFQRLCISGGEILEFRRRVEQRRRDILRSRPYAGGGNVGHGTKKRVEAAYLTEEKIAHFRDTKNKQYARAIVDFAFNSGCCVIQMEDLSGISGDDKFLKAWTYYDLQQKIQNAADEYGITVLKIEPAHTSQRCSKCGCISPLNRQKQADFACVECGYQTHADYNAARNISTPGIAEIIRRDMGANREQT